MTVILAAVGAWVLPSSHARAQQADLSAGDWSSIRAAYDAARHAVLADGDGYRTRNPGQQWSVRFEGSPGFEVRPDTGGWTWGLRLVSFGRAGAEQMAETPACLEAEGQRVSYRWDDTLTEWFINERRGLEHGFTVRERPAGAGPLLLSLAVRGRLRPRVSGDGRDVTFVNAEAAPVLNYNGLKVVDADGSPVPASFDALEDALLLTVDDRVARYPLTIDPIAQEAYLKASNTDPGDQFGGFVAMSGDTVVIGSLFEGSNATGVNGDQSDNSAGLAGAAYVFVRSGGVWSQQAYLKASNTEPTTGDGFAISGDISGDTIVIGANREDSNATGVNGNQADNSMASSGAAYVFVRNGTTWSQQAYLKASNTGASDSFGVSVAISGDTIVVGASREDSGATGVDGNQADNSVSDSGAAYVFVRNGSTWSQQAYLKASNTGAIDAFSNQAVAISGDTVVIGALTEDSSATGVNGNQADNSAPDSGAAYVFVRNGTTWTQQAYLKASDTSPGALFGRDVSVSGDTIVVGAQLGEAAYVFVRPTGGSMWSQEARLTASNAGASDNFGTPVSVSGDVVVVGATGEDSNATGVNGNQADNSVSSAGAAYVYVRSGGTWTQQAYLKASNTGLSDNFGTSVAVSGDTVVVSALAEDSSATGVNGDQGNNSALNSGAAYIFTGAGGSCTAPNITADPASQTACTTQPVVFTVAASGTGFLAYQWRKDGTPVTNGPNGGGGAGTISGAGTDTLTVSPPSPPILDPTTDAGVYDCVVTNSCGSATSAGATLVLCHADYNCDGFVDGIDYDSFNNDFEGGNMAADYNGDGFVDGIDYDSFNNDFEGGGC